MTKRRHIPIKALTTLAAVVRTGSVSAAAEDLGVTHGAVSKQLSHLEHWLGRQLFHERRRGMIANATGERLAAVVGEALDRIELALDEAAEGARQEVLTVVAPASFAMRWLIPRLPELQSAAGDVGIRSRPTHTTENWDTLEYDVIVRRGEALSARLTPRALFTEELGLLVPQQFAGETDPRCLPFVDAATRTGEVRRWCSHAFGGKPARPVKVYPHFYVATEAALSGLGAIVAPVELFGAQLAAGQFVEPWPHIRVPGAQYVIGVAPDGRNLAAADALANKIAALWQAPCHSASPLGAGF